MASELRPGTSRVIYLYGVTESVGRTIQHVGVDLLSKVEPLECEGLMCWISRVSGSEFEDELAANMENLEWLTTASVAHQRAIAAIAQETEILPARFGTVFRTEGSLRKDIHSRLPELKKDFERVSGSDEWGVKVFAVKPALARVPKIRSGRDYLTAKAALLPEKRSRNESSEELEEFERALHRVAEEAAAAGNISSGQRGLAFQISLLVKRANRKRLEAVLRKFSERWAEAKRIECTGPWPPYSFVSRHNGLK